MATGAGKGELKLHELAEQAGVSPRTVRYYLQRGLLPQPAFRGPDTAYGEEHLVRLRAIRKLQEKFLPLDAIEVELSRRSLSDIEKIAEGRLHDEPKVHASEPVVPVASGKEDVPMRTQGVRWERFAIARGLELHLADDADAATRALFEEVREILERKGNGGGRS